VAPVTLQEVAMKVRDLLVGVVGGVLAVGLTSAA
jgi:hypothetical protein